MHCLWANSDNRAHGPFECIVTWFCFCFDFVRSNAWCGYFSLVCWRGWQGEMICLKLDIQGKRRLKLFDIDRKWVRSLENYTIFRDVVCVSFLNPTVKCETCWKLTKAKTDWCYWHRSLSFFVSPGLGGLLRGWFWGRGITYARKLKLGT